MPFAGVTMETATSASTVPPWRCAGLALATCPEREGAICHLTYLSLSPPPFLPPPSSHSYSLTLQPFDTAYLASRDPPIKFLSFHSYLHKLTSGIDKYSLAPQGPHTPLILPSTTIGGSL